MQPPLVFYAIIIRETDLANADCAFLVIIIVLLHYCMTSARALGLLVRMLDCAFFFLTTFYYCFAQYAEKYE